MNTKQLRKLRNVFTKQDLASVSLGELKDKLKYETVISPKASTFKNVSYAILEVLKTK